MGIEECSEGGQESSTSQLRRSERIQPTAQAVGGQQEDGPAPEGRKKRHIPLQQANAIEYIQSQAEHRRKQSLEGEFIAFSKKNKVEYDPKYVWG